MESVAQIATRRFRGDKATKPLAAATATKKRPAPQKKVDTPDDGSTRLHVAIARSGLTSRRKAEEFILQGRVTVNGELVVQLGTKVFETDVVAVDGVPAIQPKTYTVVLFKPKGVVTTLFDPQRRPTIKQFLPDYGVALKPVGRLDMETDGLLIATNDGELAHRLAHPSYGVEKEYEAQLSGALTPQAVEKLKAGVFIEGGRTRPAQVKVIFTEPAGRYTKVVITVHEGRKRQIRLMCQAVGFPVEELRRTRYGPLKLKGMRSGEARLLGQEEVARLRILVNLSEESDLPSQKSSAKAKGKRQAK